MEHRSRQRNAAVSDLPLWLQRFTARSPLESTSGTLVYMLDVPLWLNAGNLAFQRDVSTQFQNRPCVHAHRDKGTLQ